MKRDDALRIIQQPSYINLDEEKKDIKYFLKKMNWSKDKFKDYISAKEVSHLDYNSEKMLWEKLSKFYKKHKYIKKIFQI